MFTKIERTFLKHTALIDAVGLSSNLSMSTFLGKPTAMYE